MNSFMQDVAFTWRNALRQPAETLLIVLTLALGIGANSAIFSMIHAVLLAPLPYADAERLVKLEQSEPGSGSVDFGWSGPTMRDLAAPSSAFSELFAYSQLPFPLAGQGEPVQVMAGVVDWNFFEALGVRPLLGRGFLSSDDAVGAEPVILLSEAFWRSQFGADPGVLGRSVEIKQVLYTIVGVLPDLPPYPHANDIWMPTVSDPYRLFGWTDVDSNRNSVWTFLLLGKLREGRELDEAAEELGGVARRLVASYPDDYAEDYMISLRSLQDEMVGNSGTTFLLLLGLAFLVLLIASANVTNLNLARQAVRRQELALREALGASPARLLRQVLTESTVLALLGGLLGLLIAYAGLGLLVEFASRHSPLASGIRLNAPVLLFSLALALAAGILSGSAAAFGRGNIHEALKEGGDKAGASAAGRGRRQALLTLQFALSFAVLASAALLLLSLYRLNTEDAGYETKQVLAANLMIDVPFDAAYGDAVHQYSLFSRRLLTEVRALPGVESAALLSGVPLLQELSYVTPAPFDIDGRLFADEGERPRAPYHAATADYFELLNIPLLQGRAFANTDDEGTAPVAIINESFAQRFFPDGHALGQRIRIPGTGDWRTVIGVVTELRSASLDRREGPAAYYNYWQYPSEIVTLYVRSSADAARVEEAITAIVHGIDPQQPVADFQSLDSVKSGWLAPARLRASLVFLFGLLALALTLSGVVGVVSHSIRHRLREAGVRMAVGATPSHILRLFVGQVMRLFLLGLLAGLVITLALAPLLAPFLFQTQALHLGVFFLAAAVLGIAVLLVACLTARKASGLAPVAALRSE